MNLALQSVRVGTGAEEEGLLVFAHDRLVAVLSQLSEQNEIAPGQWFLGFEPDQGVAAVG